MSSFILHIFLELSYGSHIAYTQYLPFKALNKLENSIAQLCSGLFEVLRLLQLNILVNNIAIYLFSFIRTVNFILLLRFAIEISENSVNFTN